MGSLTNGGTLIDRQRIALDDPQPMRDLRAELLQGGHASVVPLDGAQLRSGGEQRPREPAGPGPDFIDPLAFHRSRDGGDPRQQLTIQDEVLAKGLARAQPVTGDNLAQRLGRLAQAVSARSCAECAAIRIAAAIGRGSARSWPAISNAVPLYGAPSTTTPRRK